MMFKMTQERINTLVIYEFYKWSNGHYNYLMYNTFFDKRLRSLFPEWFVDYVIKSESKMLKTIKDQLNLYVWGGHYTFDFFYDSDVYAYQPIKAGDYVSLREDKIRLAINGDKNDS